MWQSGYFIVFTPFYINSIMIIQDEILLFKTDYIIKRPFAPRATAYKSLSRETLKDFAVIAVSPTGNNFGELSLGSFGYKLSSSIFSLPTALYFKFVDLVESLGHLNCSLVDDEKGASNPY
ncbi:hypothetical protein [Mesobacillus harenae]|uniref:hypothetical protein n=1 Tax=Mesobacillus harenae TaxID=2213203 RepID=UPI001580B7AA|nr:hypothetical protein [Mesobacillus harenae]